METTDLIRKVRKIEIKTKRLSNQIFAGEYHSAFKGRGISFSEVREYSYGDDIRSIDWNVTARYNHPYVKVYEEERELTVMLLIDISGSGDFGTFSQFKRDLATEISALLAFSAMNNNDKVGAIFFTDNIEKFIPPKKGRSHILLIIRELLQLNPERKGTDLNVPLRFLSNAIRKKSIAFLISDFRSDNFSDSLRIASKKHDIVALQLLDIREKEMPEVGLVKMEDSETGKMKWIDTGSNAVREGYARWWLSKNQEIQSVFSKCGVDSVMLETGKDYVKPLMMLFKKRG